MKKSDFYKTLRSYQSIKEWIQYYFGISSIDLWIKSISEELLNQTKQHFLPIDLKPILSIRRIKLENINHNLLSRDNRFMLAHEIAHTFFYNILTSPPKKTLKDADKKDVEIICDNIASEILMPEKFVSYYLKKYSFINKQFNVSFFRKLIIDFSKLFNVSIHSIFWRLIVDYNYLDATIMLVNWSAKCPQYSYSSLGKIQVDERGFIFKEIYGRKNNELMNKNYFWRVLWHVKPLWVNKELFIPTRGRAKIHFEIAEKLFQRKNSVNFLFYQEFVKSFKIGNLHQVLKKYYGKQETYPIFGFTIKDLNKEAKLLFNEKNYKEKIAFQERKNTFIILGIPIKKNFINKNYLLL